MIPYTISTVSMPNEPLVRGDDLLILDLLEILAFRIRSLLTQGMILESPEQIANTQNQIDKTRQQLERLRIVLRKQRDSLKRKREFEHNRSH